VSSPDGGDYGGFSMLDLFRQEAEQHSATLSDGLLAVEQGKATAENLESLMRAAHSIKGAARIVQIDPAVTVAHAMEDCFVAAQEGKLTLGPDHVDVLLKGVDMIGAIAGLAEGGLAGWLDEHHQDIDQLVAAVSAIKAGGGKAKKAPAKRSRAKKQTTPTTPPVPQSAPPAAQSAPPAAQPAPAAPKPASPETPPAPLADSSLLDLFRLETEEHSSTLSEGLLTLEQGTATAESLESLMRAAHSIKGAARVVQLDPAVTVAHAMEDCFVAAQKGKITLTADHVDVLLSGVDMLGQIAASAADVVRWHQAHRNDVERFLQAVAAIQGGTMAQLPSAGQGGLVAQPPSAGQGAEESVPSAPVTAEGGRATAAEDKSSPGADAITRVVRVTAENLDRLMGLAGECVVEAGWLHSFGNSLLRLKYSHAKVANLLEKLRGCVESIEQAQESREYVGKARERIDEAHLVLSESISDFELFSRRLESLTERLYREVIASRMRPFADGVQGFPRMVRDLARKLGKEVRLVFIGKSTEVDRDILDKLEAPLNHLLRNALDHGVETPEERVAVEKPREATIRVEAKHLAGMLSITVSDDGRGIDLDRLRDKIVAKKLANQEIVSRLNESELLDFLFLPAFSTRDEVTEISGRGVGLDVVQNTVHQVGGMVRASTRPGKGTTIHMQLPITLSVLRTLLVEICDEPYAFPLARIDRVLMLPNDDVEVLEDRQYFVMDGENIGLISAHQVLELPSNNGQGDALPVLVLSDRFHRYGLVVDRFLGERDLAVRPLDPRLGKVKDISAATLMENGAPVLIVDVDDLVLSMDNLLSGGRLRKVTSGTAQEEVEVRKRVLVVDDSITVREVERKLLENHGYEVDVAVDGMEGWNAVRTSHYDLVISDLDMPRMNGIEFVTRIKHDQRLKTMPVMIVSYKDREEDRMAGLEAGANYYLTKSGFHDETLVRAVIDLIGEA